MARLNEPPVSTDSIETLRRKFLRQNRDIARINSTQSLRIRSLENECARLLSENLELRGRILQLEKEAEDNTAQRIADHALDIKAKMEAQLLEWGSLLAGLGLEPPLKRHSPRGRKIARPTSNMHRSPAQRRLRDVAKDMEALAAQEGRLPPIQENKPFPRQTLNREEILALCSEATDSNESPDLGPPPTSRFAEEDPVKVDSPCRSTGIPETGSPAESLPSLPPPPAPLPKLDYSRQKTSEPEKKAQPEPSKSKSAESELPRPSMKTGSKRKFGDENEETRLASTVTEKGKENAVPMVKPLAIRDLKNRRSVKDLATAKLPSKEKPSNTATPGPQRKPLASKSTNDDLSSPKKSAKASPVDDSISKPDALKAVPNKERPREKKKPVEIPIPPIAQPSTMAILPDPEITTVEPALVCPDTPESAAAHGSARDTPPPADISMHGETSRPSRRARASISYAEPNLRDKMRRPSKQLFDAVAGEGRYIQRSSSANLLAPPSGTKVKVEGEEPDSWRKLPMADAAVAHEATRRESAMSPLAQKQTSQELLASNVITNRRKRASSMGVKESVVDSSATSQSVPERRKPAIGCEDEDATEETDPYEFTTSSPMNESNDSTLGNESRTVSAKGFKGSRRSSVAARDTSSSGRTSNPGRPIKAPTSRKRVSMSALKSSSMLNPEEPYDDTLESSGEIIRDQGDAIATRDRVSRRRSMML